MFQARIYHTVDLDNSKLNHTSVSGGRATHSFNHVMTLKDSTLDGLKLKIKSQFGDVYDTNENSMYLSIPETEWSEIDCFENYEAIIELVTSSPVTL